MHRSQLLRLSRGVYAPVVVALVGVTVLAGLGSDRALAATTRVVGPPSCSGATFSTIQAAVDASAAGDAIQVCAGTYAEQVVISVGKSNLTLQSQTPLAATIQASATLPHSQDSAIVQVDGATGVTISGFTISGPAPPTGTGAIGFGVLIDGGGAATLTGNRITAIRDDPLSGAQNGIAVGVGDGPSHPGTPTPGSVIATNNRIDGYQKGGFSIRRAGSRAAISGNTITGAGSTATIGQNGIFVRDDTTATISNNTISGNAYSPGALATGIAIVGGTVVVSGNKLDANDYGVETFLAQGAIVHGNTVTDGAYGIAVFNSTNTLVDNNSTADQDKAGLYAEDDPSGSQSNGNRFLNNTATGVTGDGDFDCLDITTGGATAGTANSWAGNAGDTARPDTICSKTPITIVVPPVIVLPPSGPPTPARPPGQKAGDRVIAKMRRNKLSSCLIEVRAVGPKRVLVARGVAHAPARGAGRLIVRIHVKPRGRQMLSESFGGVVVNVRALCRSTSNTLHGAVRSVRAVLLIEHALTPPGSWVPDQPILTVIGQRFMQHLRTRMVAVRFIRCDGYTATWLPSPAFPPTLSLQRARVVCASLKRGGGTARVRLVPHGLTDPIASNGTEAGRRINRRVFVTIVHLRVFRS